ncbi:MAG: hypothetical protein LPK38_03475 [Actinomycetes bacterium]|nr:hypothetical protein [Actinomycetes bacterium]MDX5380353.1 hypothetical protein [Actinomycetes bacterium]MDX5399135.1 hypothetical protein [Actinomycetes bacterium]MDX5450083.1 hypothetical protein [Actinomycetes bacterium]
MTHNLAGEVVRVRVLVVDGANVVGSRPDGWWRDRAGAAARLHAALAGAVQDGALDHDEIVLVLEGAARRGQEEGVTGRIQCVHAVGSGDDAIVAEVRARRAAGAAVDVVTADRGLRERVAAAGGGVIGPAWLQSRI